MKAPKCMDFFTNKRIVRTILSMQMASKALLRLIYHPRTIPLTMFISQPSMRPRLVCTPRRMSIMRNFTCTQIKLRLPMKPVILYMTQLRYTKLLSCTMLSNQCTTVVSMSSMRCLSYPNTQVSFQDTLRFTT